MEHIIKKVSNKNNSSEENSYNGCLKKFEDYPCPNCKSKMILSIFQKVVIGFCSNENCLKKWIFRTNKDGAIKHIESLNEIKVLIEFYLELPFNLGLPSGNYAFDKPNQIRLIRHMYYFQGGNEIENPSSYKSILIPQDKAFDENGLIHEDFSEYNYKRKMKTVLFKRYPINLFLTINKEALLQKLKSGINIYNIFAEDNLNIEILKAQSHYLEDINNFLNYYSLFFPKNDNIVNYQHEVRSISIYEFNQCLSFGYLIIDNHYFPLKRNIKDFTNYTGIPSITYKNNKKINEFEKLFQNRQKYPILPFQEIFNLARTLYRTNKLQMAATIIVNSMIAFEGMLNKLESIDKKFKKYKNFREDKEKNPEKRDLSTLYFYFGYKPDILEDLINNFYPNRRNLITFLNYGRLIRNQIIHDGVFSYNHQSNLIQFFKNRKKTQKKKISFNDLWNSFLACYNVLNIFILKKIYSDINWTLDNECKEEKLLMFLPREVAKRKILPISNYDWREISSHNMSLPISAVPPDKLPISINTTDGKIINLSLDFDKRKYELIDQEMLEDGDFKTQWIVQPTKISYEEFKKLKEAKMLNIPINIEGQIYNYRSCQNCNYLIPVHQNISCNNNRCKKCNTEFNLQDYAKEMWHLSGIHAIQSEQYLKAIEYFNKALEIDHRFKEAWNDKGFSLYELERYNEALMCSNKSLQEDQKYVDSLHNKSACLIKLQRYDEADKLCVKILQIDNSYGGAYYNKACIRSLKNNKFEALKFLKKAIDLKKNFKNEAKNDLDFDNIRDLKEFRDLIGV